MTRFHARAFMFALLTAFAGCGKPSKPVTVAQQPKGEPPPPWVVHTDLTDDELCGVGVAGAGYPNSPYPREQATERAVRNLAGILGTSVEEALIERATHRGQDVRFAREVHVDDALIEQVASKVDMTFWLDEGGRGPFGQPGFTYANACLSASEAAKLVRLSLADLKKILRPMPTPQNGVPEWVSRTGKQPGGKLCAVGFSLPMFHPDRTFAAVVEDIRAQLATVITTLVSSYAEELQTQRYHLFETMTVASNQAVSKGAVVTHYWYDNIGIGPFKRERTTYGWGCVYPMDVLQQSFARAEQQATQEERNVIAEVRKRAQNAFDNLEAEIEQRSTPAITQAPAAESYDEPPSLESSLEADTVADGLPPTL